MFKKKVLFIAPRFHTNQFFITKLLKENQIDVNFLSVYKGGSEDHKFLTPIFSIPSTLINWFLKEKHSKSAKDREILRKYHISSFSQCSDIYRKLNPDILIIRNLRLFISIQHFIIGLLLRKKIFLYTQNKYRENIGTKRKLFYFFLKIIRVQHFTPVFGIKTEPIIPNTMYIPFVIEKMTNKESIICKNQKTGIQIVTIGKMTERKNIKELIQSLQRTNFFAAKNNSLIIISECITKENFKYLDTVKKVIEIENSQINFHLNIDHHMVFELLKLSDLFILPSHDEPAAFSILEAMASGLAVICSDKNGTSCYVENGENGFVFEYSEDFKNLDVVLNKILYKETLVNYGLASLKRIELYHGIEKFYDNVITN